MNLYRRSSKPKSQAGDPGRPRQRPPPGEQGTQTARQRPEPQVEPIPDGEHKYVPRSPYRTGNS